jgi:hypothetical protein
LSFCCNSGSNGKTQPYNWLGTDHNNNDETKKQRQKGKRKNKRIKIKLNFFFLKTEKGKDKPGKTMNKWAYKKLPTYKTQSKRCARNVNRYILKSRLIVTKLRLPILSF